MRKLLPFFLPYCINSLIFWYNRFTAMNNKLRKDFYREMREFFRFIDERHDVGSLKNTKLDEFKQHCPPQLAAAADRRTVFPPVRRGKRGAAQNRHCLRNQNQMKNN